MTSTADNAPVTATTEPTDRSIWPSTMTKSMPIASTSTYEYWRTMFVMLPGLRNEGFSTENSTTMTTKASRMPLCWMFFDSICFRLTCHELVDVSVLIR